VTPPAFIVQDHAAFDRQTPELLQTSPPGRADAPDLHAEHMGERPVTEAGLTYQQHQEHAASWRQPAEGDPKRHISLCHEMSRLRMPQS
jgi:hypothetical protein